MRGASISHSPSALHSFPFIIPYRAASPASWIEVLLEFTVTYSSLILHLSGYEASSDTVLVLVCQFHTQFT